MPNAFAHVELSTDDLKLAKKFYKALFDWNLTDLPNMPYTMINVGTGVGGGMQPKQMPEQPNAWLPYVQVDDVKKTLAKAAKAGGRVVLPYHAIGDMGAIGIFVDPSGASLGLWEAGAKTNSKTKSPAKKAPAAKTPAAKAPAAKAKVPAAKAPTKKR